MKKLFLAVLVLAILISSVAPVTAHDGWTPAGVTGGESMAIETLTYAEFAGGAARIEFDYNRQTGNIPRIRCVNNSDRNVWGGAYLMDYIAGTETLLWEGTCAPGQTVTYPISRFDIMWDTVDGGLMMGNYQLRARWG